MCDLKITLVQEYGNGSATFSVNFDEIMSITLALGMRISQSVAFSTYFRILRLLSLESKRKSISD